jgi:hypothetical protein
MMHMRCVFKPGQTVMVGGWVGAIRQTILEPNRVLYNAGVWGGNLFGYVEGVFHANQVKLPPDSVKIIKVCDGEPAKEEGFTKLLKPGTIVYVHRLEARVLQVIFEPDQHFYKVGYWAHGIWHTPILPPEEVKSSESLTEYVWVKEE